MKFEDIVGMMFTNIVNRADEEIIFYEISGRVFSMAPCEDTSINDVRVSVEDICGDLEDLCHTPILVAREDANSDDSCTWTFYNLSTVRGSVTIRWYGESNGFYSEAVGFREVEERPYPSEEVPKELTK